MKLSILWRSFLFVLLMYYANACFSSTTVLILGDSLSAGYGLQKNQSWVDLLTAKIIEDNIDAKIVNVSVSGATTADGLRALPKFLEKYRPNIVVVALGSNDGLRGEQLIIMQKNLAQIITTAKAANAKVLLVGFQIPPNYGSSYSKSFSEVFPKLSVEYGIPLVPFLLEGFAANYRYFQGDRLHPTAEAQYIMLDNVWPYLEPLLTKS